LASSIFSPICFYNVFFQAEPVISEYISDVCIQISFINGELQCVTNEYILTKTEYNPPFSYSYECSSSIIKSYSTIYVTMAALLLLNQTTLMFISRKFYSLVNEESRIFKFVDSRIPNSMKPFQKTVLKELKVSNDNVPFKKSMFIINVVSFLTLILTCGIIIPPVGILLSGCLYVYIHTSVSFMGKKINDSKIEKRKEWICLILSYENILENIVQNINNCLYLFLLPTMGIFYSCFIFDIIGKNVNIEISVRKKSFLFICIQYNIFLYFLIGINEFIYYDNATIVIFI
jgi:hypothetical protein